MPLMAADIPSQYTRFITILQNEHKAHLSAFLLLHTPRVSKKGPDI